MASSIVGGSTKREGTAKIRSSNGTPVYECTYSFIVQATTKDENYLSVLATTGLPIVGVTAEPTGFAVCTSKTGNRRADNPFLWDIVCEFSSEIEDTSGSSGDPGSDPVTWVPIYETKFERYQEVVTRDFSGNAIANSAGQPFPNGMTITRHIPIWEFFQFEAASVTDATVLARTEVVNTSTFKGCAAKTLLCTVLSSVIGRYYGTLRRLTQYQLKYKQDKWTHKRLDVGTVYVNLSGDLKPYTRDGVVINGPLDGLGGQAADGDPPEILEFDMYQDVSFSFLRV